MQKNTALRRIFLPLRFFKFYPSAHIFRVRIGRLSLKTPIERPYRKQRGIYAFQLSRKLLKPVSPEAYRYYQGFFDEIFYFGLRPIYRSVIFDHNGIVPVLSGFYTFQSL